VLHLKPNSSAALPATPHLFIEAFPFENIVKKPRLTASQAAFSEAKRIASLRF
jgi:hypothetical protein